jgi:hypothetical protein
VSVTDVHESPLRFFDDLLFTSPEICAQCYRRIRSPGIVDELHNVGHDGEYGSATLGTGDDPRETLERVGAGELGQTVEYHDDYGVRREYNPKTYCSECGSDGGSAIPEQILSLQRARSVTDNIVRRLHELGYYPDLGVLYNTVEHLKQQPAYQGKDREIFATAVWLALDRGDDAPDVSWPPRPGTPPIIE